MPQPATQPARNFPRTALRSAPYIAVAGLALHALTLLVPYVLFNTMLAGDNPGHVFLAEHARAHLLPWPTGWNDQLWLGFPQDELYPPLVHWWSALLAALSGGLLETATAMKLLVAAATLGIFPAAFALGRALGLERAGAAGVAALVWAVQFLSASHLGTGLAYGANLESTFSAGMVVAAVGWPLLLLSAAATLRMRPGDGPSPLAAALIATTLMTHFVAGLAAALLLVLRTLVTLAARSGSRPGAGARRILATYAATGALAVGAAAVWLLPFLLRRGALEAESIGLRWAPAELATLVAAPLLAAAAAWWPSGSTGARHGRAAWALLAAAVAALTVAVDRLELATHAYRFLPLLWLGGAVGLGLLLARVRDRLPAAGALVMPLIAPLAAVGAVAALTPGTLLQPGADQTIELTPPPGLRPGRTFVAMADGHAPGHQAVQHAWATVSGCPVSHGISVESAALNRFVFNAIQELDRDLPIWSVYPPAAPPLREVPGMGGRWLRKLRHLGFRYLLTDLRLKPLLGGAYGKVGLLGEVGAWPLPPIARADELSERYVVRDGALRLQLWRLPTAPLVTLLGEAPLRVPPAEFPRAAEHMWVQGAPDRVLTDAARDLAPAPQRSLDIVEISPDGATVRFRVDASAATPALVRVPWHPGWSATADGQPIDVLRAAPMLVLLHAHGDIELRWDRGLGAWAGLALSLGTWAGLGMLGWRRRRRPSITEEPPDVREHVGGA